MLPFPILSFTDHWIAVDKPAGLPSRPGPGHPESVLSLLEAWLADQHPRLPRPGVVHRLDRETSGVLVFSLGPQGHRSLVAAFARREIEKEYSAIVHGWPIPRRGTIDLPLRRNASGRVVPDSRGLPALTRYETVRRFPGAALLRVRPRTGRMHQIRVHLAARGTPVVGDRLYGRGGHPHPVAQPPRLCLHAERLLLPDSVTRLLPGAAAGGVPPTSLNGVEDQGTNPIVSPIPEALGLYLAALGRKP